MDSVSQQHLQFTQPYLICDLIKDRVPFMVSLQSTIRLSELVIKYVSSK